MDCEFTEKVSALLDAELKADEALRVEEHIATCAACRQGREDFLRLRREIKAYDFEPHAFAQSRALARILQTEKLPLWRRKVGVPLPLMTLLLAIIFALGLFTALGPTRRVEQSKGAPENSAPVKENPSSHAEALEGGGMDFSHYDHGERAAIYKIRRTSSAAAAAPDAQQ